MKIHIHQIPDDGRHFESEEEGDILDLEQENIRCLEPVHYQVDVGISEGGLFAVGQLQTTVELECVGCLKRFSFPVEVDNFAVQMDLPGTELVDLTPLVREDIILTLPSYPHCDWNGEQVCQGPRAIAQDDGSPDLEISAWEALEKLRFEKGK